MLIFTPQPRRLYKCFRSFYMSCNCPLTVDVHKGKAFDRLDSSRYVMLPIKGSDLSSSLDFLVQEGYIEASGYGYQLTYKGKHPLQLSMQAITRFMITSVLIPIAVSFATTIITLIVRKIITGAW